MSKRKGRSGRITRQVAAARRLIKNRDVESLYYDEKTLRNTVRNLSEQRFNFANNPELRRYL